MALKLAEERKKGPNDPGIADTLAGFTSRKALTKRPSKISKIQPPKIHQRFVPVSSGNCLLQAGRNDERGKNWKRPEDAQFGDAADARKSCGNAGKIGAQAAIGVLSVCWKTRPNSPWQKCKTRQTAS